LENQAKHIFGITDPQTKTIYNQHDLRVIQLAYKNGEKLYHFIIGTKTTILTNKDLQDFYVVLFKTISENRTDIIDVTKGIIKECEKEQ
jgi:hypothetical protein